MDVYNSAYLVFNNRALDYFAKERHRRSKRPSVYYANSTATFHMLLKGDLVFKLNPGPEYRSAKSSYSRHHARKARSKCNTSNLIEIQRLPLNKIAQNSCLSLCLMNAQSIRNKTADFVDYVCENKLDLVAVTETWLQKKDDAVRVKLCPAGYKFVDHPRLRRGRGGIGLLHRHSFGVTTVRSGEEESFDYSELLIQLSSSCKFKTIIVYRSPPSEGHRVSMSTFLSEFSNFLESVILSKECLLILGDFNIHVDDCIDADAMKFLDLLDSLGLDQHITQPTHIHGHTLDLIITRKKESLIRSPPRSCHYFSDHAAVHSSILIVKPVTKVSRVT